MQLKLASINIEGSRHLARVESFLKFHKPDVLCLQELHSTDIHLFEDLFGNKLHYIPMCLHASGDGSSIGIGIIGWTNLSDVTAQLYHGPAIPQLPVFVTEADGYHMTDPASISNSLLAATCQGFRIATTHLMVTRQGVATPLQLQTAASLISLAEAEAARAGGLLLCGDFNAPRGRATFSLLADHFIDGVPAEYTTSIDGSLHRAGQLPYMVDGLFHTPTYQLEHATLHTGVSDHRALTCTLSKA